MIFIIFFEYFECEMMIFYAKYMQSLYEAPGEIREFHIFFHISHKLTFLIKKRFKCGQMKVRTIPIQYRNVSVSTCTYIFGETFYEVHKLNFLLSKYWKWVLMVIFLTFYFCKCGVLFINV